MKQVRKKRDVGVFHLPLDHSSGCAISPSSPVEASKRLGKLPWDLARRALFLPRRLERREELLSVVERGDGHGHELTGVGPSVDDVPFERILTMPDICDVRERESGHAPGFRIHEPLAREQRYLAGVTQVG